MWKYISYCNFVENLQQFLKLVYFFKKRFNFYKKESNSKVNTKYTDLIGIIATN